MNEVYVLQHIKGTIHAITADKSVADQWDAEINKDYGLGGYHGPQYTVEPWSLATTLQEALNGSKRHAAEVEARRHLKDFDGLSDEARAIVLARQAK